MTDTIPLTPAAWERFLADPTPAPTSPKEKPGEVAGYESVKYMLVQLAGKFANRYGGDHADWFVAAQEAWHHAHRKYDPTLIRRNPKTGKVGPVKYATFIQACVWRGLLNHVRIRRREAERPLCDVPAELIPAGQEPFAVRRLILELSADAAVVLRLLFRDTPDRLSKARADRIRDGLADDLAAELGWGFKRILRAFQEIREALG